MYLRQIFFKLQRRQTDRRTDRRTDRQTDGNETPYFSESTDFFRFLYFRYVHKGT